MSFYGYDPGDPNNSYQSPQRGLFPVSPAVYGGVISGGCYGTRSYHPHGRPSYPPPPSQFPSQFPSQPSYPPPPPSHTIINGYVFPHQFPHLSANHAQLSTVAPSPHNYPCSQTQCYTSTGLYNTTHQSPLIPIHPHPSEIYHHYPPTQPHFIPTKQFIPPPLLVSTAEHLEHPQFSTLAVANEDPSSISLELEMGHMVETNISTKLVGLGGEDEVNSQIHGVNPELVAQPSWLLKQTEPRKFTLHDGNGNAGICYNSSFGAQENDSDVSLVPPIVYEALKGQETIDSIHSLCLKTQRKKLISENATEDFVNPAVNVNVDVNHNSVSEVPEFVTANLKQELGIMPTQGNSIHQAKPWSVHDVEVNDERLEYHALHLFDKMPRPDLYSRNAILGCYCKAEGLMDARELFLKMPERNIFSWKTLISSLVQNGQEEKALGVYDAMISEGMVPTHFTLAIMFSACGGWLDVEKGRKCHSLVEQIGLEVKVYVGNTLLCMYVKCGVIKDAMQVFGEMAKPNEITVMAGMGGLKQMGKIAEALEIFRLMCRRGMRIDSALLFVDIEKDPSLWGATAQSLGLLKHINSVLQVTESILRDLKNIWDAANKLIAENFAFTVGGVYALRGQTECGYFFSSMLCVYAKGCGEFGVNDYSDRIPRNVNGQQVHGLTVNLGSEEVGMASTGRLQECGQYILESLPIRATPHKKVFSEEITEKFHIDECPVSITLSSKKMNETAVDPTKDIVDDNQRGMLNSSNISEKETAAKTLSTKTENLSFSQVPKLVYTRKKVQTVSHMKGNNSGPVSKSIIYKNNVPETYPSTETLQVGSSDDNSNKRDSFCAEAKIVGRSSLTAEKPSMNSKVVLNNLGPAVLQDQALLVGEKDTSYSRDLFVSHLEDQVDNNVVGHENLLQFKDSETSHKHGPSLSCDPNSIPFSSDLKPHNMELNNGLAGILELVGCYTHPVPVLSVLLSTKGNHIYICVLCGLLVGKDISLFIYKVDIEEPKVGHPSLVGHTSVTLPDLTDYFGGMALGRSCLQLTPDGQCLVLLNSIKTPFCRQGKTRCLCTTCASSCSEENAVKIVQVKLGYVSLVARLKAVESQRCILVCEPSNLVSVAKIGRLHMWVMDSNEDAKIYKELNMMAGSAYNFVQESEETNGKCTAPAIAPMVSEENEQVFFINVILQVLDFSTYSVDNLNVVSHDLVDNGLVALHLILCLLINGESNTIVINWISKLKTHAGSSTLNVDRVKVSHHLEDKSDVLRATEMTNLEEKDDLFTYFLQLGIMLIVFYFEFVFAIFIYGCFLYNNLGVVFDNTMVLQLVSIVAYALGTSLHAFDWYWNKMFLLLGISAVLDPQVLKIIFGDLDDEARTIFGRHFRLEVKPVL